MFEGWTVLYSVLILAREYKYFHEYYLRGNLVPYKNDTVLLHTREYGYAWWVLLNKIHFEK